MIPLGARGPQRKPAALSILEGDAHVKRAQASLQAPTSIPVYPESFADDYELRQAWDYYLGELRKMRSVSTPDLDTLLTYCDAVITARRLVAECRNAELTLIGARGGSIANPLFAMKTAAQNLERQYARELGFTPAARADMPAGGAGADDDGVDDF